MIEFGQERQVIRPFQASAQIHCRGYSKPLQRVITDFGADVPFGQIPKKLLEHHGFSVPISSTQGITQSHAQTILENQTLETQLRRGPSADALIAQMDGSMIAIVQTTPTQSDAQTIERRKTLKLGWKEARLAFAQEPQQPLPIFGAIGSVDDAGAQLLHSAIRAGLGAQTFVHGVGDGASWIAKQMDAHFCEPGRFLLDFYHLCDYLAHKSHVCAPHAPKAWMEQQKKRLKLNHFKAVLKELKPFQEADSVPDNQAPLRAAYRYLYNRPHHPDYKGVIASGLPIGSGEIESAHRYIIQNRLKRSGAWWTVENAEAMLALRVLRANQNWDDYWLNLASRGA